MTEDIIVTVLVENSAQGRGLIAEHGLAFHIQTGGKSLLFDTGQSALLEHNARTLGIDLAAIDAIVLSHGHYDHVGGLRVAWELAPNAPLYTHAAALVPRFARNPDGTTRPVGPDALTLQTIRARGRAIIVTASTTEVLPGIFATGEIPRSTDFEDVGGPFVLDQEGARPDPIIDDQALFFGARDGTVVLLGCAHAGVINTLNHIRRMTQGRPIQAVLGGMHLLVASPERMARTIGALRALGVRRLGPAHCTGTAATASLWHEFPDACTACSVGSRFVFRPPQDTQP